MNDFPNNNENAAHVSPSASDVGEVKNTASSSGGGGEDGGSAEDSRGADDISQQHNTNGNNNNNNNNNGSNDDDTKSNNQGNRYEEQYYNDDSGRNDATNSCYNNNNNHDEYAQYHMQQNSHPQQQHQHYQQQHMMDYQHPNNVPPPPQQHLMHPPFPYQPNGNHQPPMNMMYPNNSNNNFQPHFPMPPALPLVPLPPPPPPPSSNLNGDNNNLDATRQYYEARMREHAMQYANAAAGAAWAAARIACGEEISGDGGMMMMPSYYDQGEDGGMAMTGRNQHQLQRTLWEPTPSSNNQGQLSGGSKKGGMSNDVSFNSKRQQQQQQQPVKKNSPSNQHQHHLTSPSGSHHHEKKRSKKRVSGNSSVTSLGSGGRDLGSAGDNCKQLESKKGNQRRRIYEDTSGNLAPREEGRRSHGSNDNSSNNSHQRQKRGLYQGYSSRGSSSSLATLGSGGGNNSNTNAGHPPVGRNKKKNRLQQETSSPRSSIIGANNSMSSSQNNNNHLRNTTPSGVFLGGLIGKSGVSALYELCSKYRWEMPRYDLIEPPSLPPSKSNDNNVGEGSNVSRHSARDFVLSVHVNEVELGRGRGGTKASAKQDASRKALAALVPGVIFDPNGILLDVGSGLLRIIDENARSVPTSLEELAPHLASQLAIGGGGGENHAACGVRTRPSSPDPSEDSSISTAVSMTKMVIGGSNDEGVISGGPLSSKGGVLSQHPSPGGAFASLNFAIYPSASSTSEVDEDDENAYYASRGASICSTLLHAMWQIDQRIRDPPSYGFELLKRVDVGGGEGVRVKSEIVAASSKRKTVGSPVESTAHRMPFQCTATLTLHFPKTALTNHTNTDLMEYWISPLEHLQSKQCAPSPQRTESSRKRKDSFASQATPSPHRRKGSDAGDQTEEQMPVSALKDEEEEFVSHKLESVGTGTSKRESKHKASAQMLSFLFPECNSMVEVKAAAEAARECFAANKAAANQTKRAKLSNERSLKMESKLASPFGRAEQSDEQALGAAAAHRLLKSENRSAVDSFVSVAGLSLGESKRIKWSDSELSLEKQENAKNEIDAALHALQYLNEEGRWTSENSLESDVGKPLLRRATHDDLDHILALFSKVSESPPRNVLSKKQRSSSPNLNRPLQIDGDEGRSQCPYDDDHNTSSEFLNLLREGSPIVLLLSRAVASHDEPPLGVAIIGVREQSEGRSLALFELCHREHLPKERFVECLESLAKSMNCNLDGTNISERLGSPSPNIVSFVRRYISADDCNEGQDDEHAEEEYSGVKSPHSQLQSVKEEDSEEVEDGSENDGKDLSGLGRKRSRVG